MAISYETFIGQLKILITQAENFQNNERNAESEAFKDWKLEATELVWSVERLGYALNSGVGNRLFTVKEYYSPVSANMKNEKFAEDLGDTLREFRLILKNYEANGVPHKVRNLKVQEEHPILEGKAKPSLDEKLTVDWLLKNVPVSWWVSAAGILVFVLGSGFTAGRLYESDFLSIKTFISEKFKNENPSQ